MIAKIIEDIVAIGKTLLRAMRQLGVRQAGYQFARALKHSLRYFMEDFSLLTSGTSHLDKNAENKFQKRIAGLHALLPDSARYSCSLVVSINGFKEIHQKTLECCFQQTSPNLEIIIGCLASDLERIKSSVAILNSAGKKEVKIFANTGVGALLEATTKNFILLVEPNVWLRPDLLYRFEQTLRLYNDPENLVLFCEDGTPGQGRQLRCEDFRAPYYFENSLRGAMLFSHPLLKKIGKVNSTTIAPLFFEFIYSASSCGAQVVKIPIKLYGFQSAREIISTEGMIENYKRYLNAKAKNWEVLAGDLEETIRVIPDATDLPSVTAIIPYKDQRDLTLRAVRSLQRQSGVECRIVCVDNNSENRAIASELKKMGAEVLEVFEPFNFSRINNLAVQFVAKTSSNSLLFFMNNDVELESGALKELAGWANQADVGLVGCRLHYPTGGIQHGGIDLTQAGASFEMNWAHVDSTKKLTESARARVIRNSDAVTGAAFMVAQKKFSEVGGFDEVYYPIGFSDTDLARRLRKAGYVSIYTPFASGVHHESASRGRGYYEDFEGSRWLFRATEYSREGRSRDLTNFDV